MISEQPTEKSYQFSNESRVKRMLWIGFYTLLLNLITLTLFRFWGRTHFRRQLWSDTSIDGDNLEYTGKGKELFIGFLIAIFTVMLPTVALILGAQLFLGDAGAAVAITIVYIGMFWLVGVAIFLARRYMVSRTRYRGIRFEQQGSATDYGWRAFGFAILTGITLGWYAPAARIRLSRYMWSNALYGNERIKFEDTEEALAEPVYVSFTVLWFGTIILYVAFSYVLYSMEILQDAATGNLTSVIMFYGTLIVFGIVLALYSAWHYLVVTRRIIKSLRLQNARATCDLQFGQLIGVWFLGALLTIVTLGVGLMAARMMSWRIIANHTSFEGEIDFDSIEQAASTGPSQGEGIADGFDIGAGF